MGAHVEDSTRLIVALAASFGFAVLALLTWLVVRAEQARRPPRRCERLHVEELHARLMDAPLPEDGLTLPAEDLPAFRGPTRPVVDEDEVNPTFPIPPR
jgi:hypothetical protein